MARYLERYTPEVCSRLRQIAERREWRDWKQTGTKREDLLEEMELTYHLHRAAEAVGKRNGLPPMPLFPIRFIDSEGLLDPVEFINEYHRRHHSPGAWNQMDNAAHAGIPPTSWVAAACLAARLM